nr:sortase [uncultured Agathobaculum sp.]
MAKTKYKVMLGAGLLLIAAALALAAYNVIDAQRAARSAAQALEALSQTTAVSATDPEQASADDAPAYLADPEMPMPTVSFDGNDYIGRVDVPSLGLSLPVISEWSYPRLKIAPCRYTGSAYLDNLIIAAHNYSSHFGNLNRLNNGDTVTFTDVDGNQFTYAVSRIEDLPGTAIEEMQAGEWDLTLFTCTLGGRSRVTVRCERTADS